jgi:hypothetical protein
MIGVMVTAEASPKWKRGSRGWPQFHEWRILADFWRKKAGAGRAPSLISACAAGTMPRSGRLRTVPWREGALRNKRTFRRAFAARFLLPAAGGRAAHSTHVWRVSCMSRTARRAHNSRWRVHAARSLLPFGGSGQRRRDEGEPRVDDIDASAVPLAMERRRRVRCSSIRFEPLTVRIVPDLAAVAVGLPVVLRRGAGGLKALGVCCMCSVVQR